MAQASKKVITGRGQKARTYNMKGSVDEEEMLKVLLGPSGNLRAPTLKIGATLLVGWCEPAWLEFFGDS
ncbi:MAG TPA: hypothetical protein DDW23_04825 [Planctomycetes bacterium]|mgnify:CR=1 FL=1|nr:hypothetical protein [Planctomycetota bacterium]|tara:strand:- start:47 stop:253 length:207 start_codon:yes stop_codon:yes gene_type:complete